MYMNLQIISLSKTALHALLLPSAHAHLHHPRSAHLQLISCEGLDFIVIRSLSSMSKSAPK